MKMSKEELRSKIEDWFEQHRDEMLDDLRQLISIASVRGAAEEGAPYGSASKAALMLAGSMLETRGFTVREFEDIIITTEIGPAPPFMGIFAHVDVVGVGDGWNSDPFEMTVIGDKIFGRGATDNKGPSIAAMYAMYCARDLFPELRNGFQLLLGSGEESGCIDIAQYLKKNEPPPHVFTPDANYPMVNTEKGRITPFFSASWEKDSALPRVVSIIGGGTTNVVPDHAEAVVEGFALDEAAAFCREYSEKTDMPASVREDAGQLIISIDGISAHAANPHLGSNAQTALLELLVSMPFAASTGFEYIRALNRLFPHGDHQGSALGIAMSDDISGQLTLNFGVLKYSETGFSGNFDSRTPACADELDLLGIVAAALEAENITMTNHTISHCHHTPEDSLFVKTLLDIYEDYTGGTRYCLAVGGQTYVHEIPGGVAFGVSFPGVDNLIHGANEFIGMEQLMVSAKMFAQAILEMCG